MNNKFLLLLLFSFSISVEIFAQSGVIKGNITDDSGIEVPFASIAIRSKDNTDNAIGGVSDINGDFKIQEVPFGLYDVEISFIGYDTKVIKGIEIKKGDKRLDLGDVELLTSSQVLDDVEVVAHRSTVVNKIDRKTYNTADFETAKGGSAVDILGKLPSVSVTPDGEVSVRGATDFMVYVNGKPTQMDPSMLLASMSSNQIENIEVITIPTSKYDAQGKGGIINITTKRTGEKGWSMSANGLVGGAPWGNRTDEYSGYNMNDNRYAGGLNFNYIDDKLSIYGALNYTKKNVNGERDGDARLLQDPTTTPSENAPFKDYYHMVASGLRPEWDETYSAMGGITYSIDDASSLSASYSYSHRNKGRAAFYVYNNFYADKDKSNKVAEEWIYNPNTDNRYGEFHSANIDYTAKLDNDDNMSVSFIYEHSNLSSDLSNEVFDFDQPNDKVGAQRDHFRQNEDSPLNGFRLSFDYDTELENGDKIGFGFQPQYLMYDGKFNYDTLNVASGSWGDYSTFENEISLKRGIYAGYVDYSGTYGKLNYIVGMRLEYTDQNMHIDNLAYYTEIPFLTKPQHDNYYQKLDWFPTLHLDYRVTDKDQFIFAASRRINRPPTKNMAPYLYRRHYEVYVIGDTSLKPEYNTNFELTYNKKIGSQNIGLTGFYRGTTNAIFRVNTVYNKENTLIRSYTNSGNSIATGAELNTDFELTSWAKLFLGGSLYHYNIKGEVFGYYEDNSSLNWSFKGNLNIALTRELKFTTDFDIKSATVTAQGDNEMFYMTNAALSYNPNKLKSWSFSLRGLDLLSSNITGLNTRANDSNGEIFYQETTYTRYGPIVELSATYTLNFKSKKKSGKTFGAEQF